MKRIILAAAIALLSIAAVPPAEARVSVGIGFGGGCCYGGYYPGYYGYPAYYAYPPAYYAPPPTVVYAQPPQQTVIYSTPQPAPQVQYQYAPQAAAPQALAPASEGPAAPAAAPAMPVSAGQAGSVAASQASETYTDDKGRTCRHFETKLDSGPLSGTACLQPDGSWRTVGE